MHLTGEQWRLIEPLLPPPSPSGRGCSARAQAQLHSNNGKRLSSATHVAEAADGGWKPPRLVAAPATAGVPHR